MPDKDEASLRDQISEALEEEPKEEVVEAEEKPAAEESVVEPEKAETPVEATPETPEKAPEGEKVEDPVKPEEELDAPAHWSLEDQEAFRALDGKSQNMLLDRSKAMEAAHTKRSQEIAPIRAVVQKWQPYIDKLGATPEQAVDALFAAEYTLRTGTEAQKRGALLKLANDYGIPLGAPADGAKPDFMTAEVQKVVRPLEERVGVLQSQLSQRDMQTHQAQAAQAEEQVRQFREATTEAGQMAHPYYAEVETDMTRLAQAELASGNTPVLQTLYETAIWANPTVRAKLQSAQQHAAKKQDERARKEKVEKAKNASVSVTGVSSTPKDQPKSLREDLEGQFARA